MVRKSPRDVWLIDCNPADVHGSDMVSEPNESATHAFEAFSMPVLFRYVATIRAGSACVLWIHKSKRNACQLSLIFNEALKLTKAPRMLDASLVLVNRYPTADTFEIFEGYSAVGVFGFRNQRFGNDMVDVPCEKRFSRASFFEQTPCRLCSDNLQSVPEFCLASSHALKFVAAPRLSVGVSGDAIYAEVDSKPPYGVVSRFFRDFNNHRKIEEPISQYEVCLSSDVAEFFRLVGSEFHGDSFSAIQCQDRYSVHAFPAEYALVVNYGSVASEIQLGVSVAFECFRDFANCSDGQLCGQAILASDLAINKPLELDLVCSSKFKCVGCYFVAGFIKRFHRLKEIIRLLRIRQQFSEERLLHKSLNRVIQYLRFSNSFYEFLKEVNFGAEA
jgi:hypothetical protein